MTGIQYRYISLPTFLFGGQTDNNKFRIDYQETPGATQTDEKEYDTVKD